LETAVIASGCAGREPFDALRVTIGVNDKLVARREEIFD
jgi:hypothetical protein